MKKRMKRKCSLTVMIGISLIIAGIISEWHSADASIQGKEENSVREELEMIYEAEPLTQVCEREEPATVCETEESMTVCQTEELTTVYETEDPETAPETEEPASIPGNLKGDSLFIGDSRTEGLEEYANLGEADFFAQSGMSVYKVFDVKDEVAPLGKITLEELLEAKKYERIYLMLGINELGYNFDRTVAKYEETVLRLKELQPSAAVIVEANLHVTGEKSKADETFNTANIEHFNQSIKAVAERTGCSYIDVNVLFDDEEGNLGAGYTFDGVHVLGKYYQPWADWIMVQ